MIDLECFAYSVGHQEEGVCLQMRMGPYRIIIECGLEDISPIISKSKREAPPDLVICSHAHADHARGLLALHQNFPNIPIYVSEVTAQLLPINWPTGKGELYPENFFHPLPWNSQMALLPNLTIELFPAGHIPGATAFLLTYTTTNRVYKIFYTGDCFLSNSRLVDGLQLTKLRGLKPDILIIEGSYGTARHPHRRLLENQLAERIYRAIMQGYTVFLPTPPLGLGQELLMLLRSHHYFTGRDLDIWVDGQVALGCDLYGQILPHLPTSVQNFAQHQPLFWDEKIRPRVRRLLPEHLGTLGQTPCIVLTDENTNLTAYLHSNIKGWLVMSPQHPGKEIELFPRDNNSNEYPELSENVRNLISEVSPFMQLENYLLSEHCDGSATTQLIHNIRPQHIILVHGNSSYLTDIANLDELRNRYQVHLPSNGSLVELPIGEVFLRPTLSEVNYEGELTEFGEEIIISLPMGIAEHPRWSIFADTGLVEARWQGEELVLRGLSQRELLSQGTDRVFPNDLECCGNCIYFRGQRCWQQSSPLFGFKVTPDGYCPAFESIHQVKLEGNDLEIDVDNDLEIDDD